MKQLTLFLVVSFLLAGCSHVAPPDEFMKSECGPYPDQYKAMLTDYIQNELNTPDTKINMSVIKTPSEIKIDADYPFIPLFKEQAVWECFIAYNVIMPDGVTTNKTFHVAWIRYNRLVAFDYKDIDLGYAIKNRGSGKFQSEKQAGASS